MKKTYIEPKNTVVLLKLRDNVMQALSAPQKLSIPTPSEEPTFTSADEIGSREVISTPDVWEEW